MEIHEFYISIRSIWWQYYQSMLDQDDQAFIGHKAKRMLDFVDELKLLENVK